MSPTNQIRNQNLATATMMDSYRVGSAGAVKRIGAPHEHDVLSGRGGAINSHVGNTHFREWVRERKNRYNLARTKAEKASVANEVMDLVRNQNPPGRFLQRDQSSVIGGTAWWVECDEIKAMAKTSQALREGAPSIRAAHKDELTVKKRTRKTKRSSATAHKATPTTGKRGHQLMQRQPLMTTPSIPAVMSSAPAQAPVPAALPMSQSQAMEQLKANVEAAANNSITAYTAPPPSYTTLAPAYTTPVAPVRTASNPIAPTTTYSYELPRVKRSRLSENLYLPVSLPQPHIVRPDDETPPLAPLPSPVTLSSIPELGETFPMPAVPKRENSLRRANSLALSDVGSGYESWGDVEFVNPFEGDTSEEVSAMPPFTSPFDTPPKSSRNSVSNMSVKSELSDLCDVNAPGDNEFGEGMKDVYDAVHPGLASPANEPIPTHLYPYRGTYDLTLQGYGESPQLIRYND